MPVTLLYQPLYQQDHFAELTGRPQWEMHNWLHADPEDHLRTYLEMVAKTPFDVLEPQPAPSRQQRESTDFVARDGALFRRDKRRDTFTRLAPPMSGHALDQKPNQTQYVFDKADVAAQVKLETSQQMLARGDNDYLNALVGAVGHQEFILSGGVIGTLYSCTQHVGMANLYPMLVEQPDLIEYLSHKILEVNIEQIRRLAAAGGDAIFIDDATATSDMISVAHYQRFSLPHVKEMVREIHALGHKAILIYFGGIADRLDQIASVDADALSMETSMKSYVNDIAEIAQKVGDRMALFGNIDPLGVLQRGSPADLDAEIARQVAAGKRARGFVISPGSPITPGTPLSRVCEFIDLSHKHGAPRSNLP